MFTKIQRFFLGFTDFGDLKYPPKKVMDVTDGFWFHRPALNTNSTVSFLLTTDTDIGELLMVKLLWEKDSLISWPWWNPDTFHIRKLRVKSGETQSK